MKSCLQLINLQRKQICSIKSLYNQQQMRFSQKIEESSVLLMKDQDDKSSYETFEQKKNLVLVEDKFTDFQKTFGFYENIEELKKVNEQKEKRRFYSYGLGALVGIGIVTGVLLIGIDPAIDKSLKRAYYVHSCNLKLKKQNIINLRGTSKKKLKIIEEYFENMKKVNSKQPAYNLYLVEEIRSIIQRHSILNDQQIITECIKYLSEIQVIMESSQKYSIYYDQYFKSIESIVSNLIQSNIQISDNQLQNICSFCFIKTDDHRQMNTFIAYLKLNRYNLNEQKPQLVQDIIQKSLQIINLYNSNEQEFQFKHTLQTQDSSYVNPEEFLKFYDEYKKQYYNSTLYQISDLINQLQRKICYFYLQKNIFLIIIFCISNIEEELLI
ncbi:transmembrane protein, putative (macronuclear) [Tetrahymena thermophila SB210]|uniref:Transmembrane protein, putative n=1 Tax=Tetrahymena thermophila (strain SB210) TaxID=312017 RepID=I7LWG3_TETTS|nr:transmembrane protein, putative [Tetrahymena thermophila SB210]EAS01745.2 transmembrane protein, putative [Tetrahymena thermophila SB210]|eukprot:XP_001021990.2 transmembrane protein, putative [Tetrahymena thermophila SB210]